LLNHHVYKNGKGYNNAGGYFYLTFDQSSEDYG